MVRHWPEKVFRPVSLGHHQGEPKPVNKDHCYWSPCVGPIIRHGVHQSKFRATRRGQITSDEIRENCVIQLKQLKQPLNKLRVSEEPQNLVLQNWAKGLTNSSLPTPLESVVEDIDQVASQWDWTQNHVTVKQASSPHSHSCAYDN